MEWILSIRYGLFKFWVVALVFTLGATIEVHADPITFSWGVFFTSLAVSAATTAASILLTAAFTPRPKPIDKNKLQGEIQLSNTGEDLPINEIYGARLADGLGGIKVGVVFIHASEIYGYVTQKSTSGGGGGGKGGFGQKSGTTKEYHYFIDLACLVGLNRTRILEIKAGTETIYRNYPKPDAAMGTSYQAEAATLSGGAVVNADGGFSGGFNVNMPAGSQAVFSVAGDGKAHAIYLVYYALADKTALVTINGVSQQVVLPNTYGRIESVMLVGTTNVGSTTVTVQSQTNGLWLDKITVAEAYAGVTEHTIRRGGLSGVRHPSYVNPDDEYNPFTLRDPNLEDWRPAEEFNYQPNYNTYGETAAQLPAGCTLRIYDGSNTQLPDPMLQEYYEANFGVGSTPAFRYRSYFTLQKFEITKYGAVPNITVIAESVDRQTVGAMYAHRSERAGLVPGDEFDYSALDAVPMRGFCISQRQAPNKEMEVINRVLDLDVFENPDGVIEGVIPSDTVVAQIPKEELDVAAGAESAEKVVGIEAAVRTEYELPRRFDFSYFDPRKDFEIGNTHATRLVTVSEKRENLESSLVLTEEEAQAVVNRMYQKEWAESGAESFPTTWKYGYLRPTDLVEVEDLDGNWNKIRIKARNGNVPGVLKFTGVTRNLSETYPRIFQVSNTTPKDPGLVPIPGHAIGTVFDDAILRVTEDVPGWYAGCCLTDPIYDWTGGGLWWERETGYELLEVFPTQATIGKVVGTMPDVPGGWSDNSWDTTTVLTVDNFFGEFDTKTDAEVLDGANVLIVGSEVVAFANATLVPGYKNRWQLSRLRRRLRGTYSDTHVAGERTMLLNDSVKFVEMDADEFGKTRNYKFVTGGQDLSSASFFEFTWDGRTQYNTTGYQTADAGRPILPDAASGPTARFEDGEWHAKFPEAIARGNSVYLVEWRLVDVTLETQLTGSLATTTTQLNGGGTSPFADFPATGQVVLQDLSRSLVDNETAGYQSKDNYNLYVLSRGEENSRLYALPSSGVYVYPVVQKELIGLTYAWRIKPRDNDCHLQYRVRNRDRVFSDGWSRWSSPVLLAGLNSTSPPPVHTPPPAPPPEDDVPPPVPPIGVEPEDPGDPINVGIPGRRARNPMYD